MTPVKISLTECDDIELKGTDGCNLGHEMEIVPEAYSVDILEGKANNSIFFVTEHVARCFNRWSWCARCGVSSAYTFMERELMEYFLGPASSSCSWFGLGASFLWWTLSARDGGSIGVAHGCSNYIDDSILVLVVISIIRICKFVCCEVVVAVMD